MDIHADKKQEILRLIEERKRAEDIIEVDEKRIQLVIFSLAGELYGFFGKYVKGIVSVETIAPVPGAPDYILGLTNVRGDIEAALDLKVIIDLPQSFPDRKSRLIITRVKNVSCGMLADRVEEVASIPESQIIATGTSKTVNPLVAGKTSYDGNDVVVLDIPKIFKHYLNFPGQ
ncbi:MAG: hypothetical protein B6244_10635 [Candidatus Cloacimonetes bacterium 4572_55]|nr:MAG: hypothetical protein B6244_10635 [Candidatus Cloacimonetes bacterium 4572_55]